MAAMQRGAGHGILIAIDLSQHSKEVVENGLFVAERRQPAILLHVVDDRFPYPDFYAIQHPGENYFQVNRRRALERMSELAGRLGGHRPVETVVAHGRPWEMIVDIAEQKEASLIVIGAIGTGEHRNHFGPTAERVVRHAGCSVLVVRPAHSAARSS
jgi:nucleotide-binding universal stress UspA family protein